MIMDDKSRSGCEETDTALGNRSDSSSGTCWYQKTSPRSTERGPVFSTWSSPTRRTELKCRGFTPPARSVFAAPSSARSQPSARSTCAPSDDTARASTYTSACGLPNSSSSYGMPKSASCWNVVAPALAMAAPALPRAPSMPRSVQTMMVCPAAWSWRAIATFRAMGFASPYAPGASAAVTSVPSSAKQKRIARAPRTSPLRRRPRNARSLFGVPNVANAVASTAKKECPWPMSRAMRPDT
mmetsp:Transcript_36265/g.112219  ORF Transcript_36265/g.112219 Transcript_36265/m.112219 type:complete len:241 (+) Transcript_36265:776-1498(+)